MLGYSNLLAPMALDPRALDIYEFAMIMTLILKLSKIGTSLSQLYVKLAVLVYIAVTHAIPY